MHRTCKKHLSKPDRNGWIIRSEKLCEGKLSTSLLEGFTCSDAAQSNCENRTVFWFENIWKSDMPVLKLGRWPLTTNWKLENCRYDGMISPDITISNHRLRWAVDGMRFTAALLSKKFTSFQMVHTHTSLTHNSLTHNSLSHNSLTLSHTTPPHTTYSHTTASHTTPPHTTYSHTTASHTTLSHTCSELSLRIWLWSASYVQKHQH